MEGVGEDEKKKQPLVPAPPAEETLLRCQDLASSLRLLRTDCLNTGMELLRRIQERLLAILQHSTQVPLLPATRAPALDEVRGLLMSSTALPGSSPEGKAVRRVNGC